MELVELVPTAKVARELATQVAQCIIVREGSTPECRQRVQAFYDQCKAHVRHNDSPGFVSTVLSSAGVDLMACPKRRGESAVHSVVPCGARSDLTVPHAPPAPTVLEDIFSVLVSLLNSASATHDVEPTLAQLRSVVTSDTTDKKESRLLMCVGYRAPVSPRRRARTVLTPCALALPCLLTHAAWARASTCSPRLRRGTASSSTWSSTPPPAGRWRW